MGNDSHSVPGLEVKDCAWDSFGGQGAQTVLALGWE